MMNMKCDDTTLLVRLIRGQTSTWIGRRHIHVGMLLYRFGKIS